MLRFLILLVASTKLVIAAGLYDIETKDIAGRALKLSKYRDKVVLIVNIATQCGYTPQLEGLEGLYQKYQAKGLVILGVPANDFGGQTPESNQEVAKFCKLRYGVSFPLTIKKVVTGESKDKLISFVLKSSDSKAEIKWNFEKFLFDRNGNFISRYRSADEPLDSDLEKRIKALLKN